MCFIELHFPAFDPSISVPSVPKHELFIVEFSLKSTGISSSYLNPEGAFEIK